MKNSSFLRVCFLSCVFFFFSYSLQLVVKCGSKREENTNREGGGNEMDTWEGRWK